MTEIINPSILSGFMELLPEDQVLFDRIKDSIEDRFQLYGFWPLDTPAIEKNEILFAKGGGETTKQIYRIEKGENSQEQSLRFDLTVPLARYVAQHSSELSFPFRRYQIAKVYRGERSQKGRYREFYQCDIDIVGRDRLDIRNDAEIPSVIYDIFRSLNLGGVTIHVNNRRLLNGYFSLLAIEDPVNVLRSIDKLAKIGREKVADLLTDYGVKEDQQEELFRFLREEEDNRALISRLESTVESYRTEEGQMETPAFLQFKEGVEDLVTVYKLMQEFGVPESAIKLDLSITRGLDYYTGTVFESFLVGHEEIGSVCSGGRYDDLASNFTKEKLPGIGVSIGLTRLFYQLTQAGLLETDKGDYITALVIPMSDEDLSYSIGLLNDLRSAGVRSQIYLEEGKMKKRFTYADQLGARYALIIGESERSGSALTIKDLKKGEQKTMPREEGLAFLKEARA